MGDEDIQKAIQRYLTARRDLLALGEQYPERFGGNDNIIGRIGEFVALRYLEQQGRRPRKVEARANPGFDLVEGDERIQVKVITRENKSGSTVPLHEDWTQFMLIEFNEEYRPVRIGQLTKDEHQQALKDGFAKSETPTVRRSMLNPRGLIGRYGEVETVQNMLI